MNRPLGLFAAGLVVVSLLWALGIAWPQSRGYSDVFDWLRDRSISDAPKYDRQQLSADLRAADFALGEEAYVRIFKRERLLELWMRRDGGRFALFRAYPICTYSGTLGPKLAEGDQQAPEGFYRVAKTQLNPKSRHHLAFNLGFPNALDRGLGRTGSALMVHGGCTSIGCYAMTDAQIDEIYAVVEAALTHGQNEVDVSIFPFQLTETALQSETGSQWLPFWRNLKQGFDRFEADRLPPRVAVCKDAYVFGDDAAGESCTPITGWA